MKFVASYTEDGSIGLYNPEVGDIYHSVGGAYQEASDKFVEPLGVDIYSKKSLRCLDICYGMGAKILRGTCHRKFTGAQFAEIAGERSACVGGRRMGARKRERSR